VAANLSIFRQRDFLVATVQLLPTDEDLVGLRNCLLEAVGHHRALGVILDVSGLDVMDSYSARVLRDLAQMLRLRGAETVIVGIQPEVAFAMVQLGLRLEGVETALDIEEGIAYLDRKRGHRQSSSQQQFEYR